MAKILIAITADIYVRNYLRTDALKKLSQSHDVSLVADSSIELLEEVAVHPLFSGVYSRNNALESRHLFLFFLMMWRYRKKSPTFFYRWTRLSQWDLLERNRGFFPFALSLVRWLAGAFRNPLRVQVPILASGLIFPLAQSLIKRNLPVNPSLEAIVGEKNYDLIIFPSAAFDSPSVDLARLGKARKIPTLCLIDNWDNLTSKTVFWAKPDHLGVWGEQAREQACEIHGFSHDQVHLLGTPRFDQYFEAREHLSPPAPYKFPYILFVGSAMPFDEIGALHELEGILATVPNVPDGTKIVYRPHPWQQKRLAPALFIESSFVRTVLDSQIADAYAEGISPEKTTGSFQPELSYYPALFSGCLFVIGPLTTMLFEGALSLKPVIGLGYPDGVHRNTTRRYFSHFDNTEKIPGFSVCEDRSEIEALVGAAIHRGEIDASASDQQTKYFLHHDDSSYPQRLSHLAGQILATDSDSA
jgi:hypothetical protein